MSQELVPGPRQDIRVLVIPGADPVGDWMGDVVKSEDDMLLLGLVRNLSQALEAIERLTPDVILLDIGSGILKHSDLINRLAAPVSGAAVIVVAMMGEVDIVRQAMLYGAQGFLLKPFGEADLISSIRQAYELITQRRAEVADLPRLEAGSTDEPSAQGQVIAVFSPKGGVGCTTIATNLAVALKATAKKPTILVDGDLRFGDIDTALNLASATSIGTLLPKLDELDNALLKRSLVSHGSGIQVLTAPHHLDAADTIRPEELKQLLLRLTMLGHGFVVVDTWSTLDDSTLAVLDTCQHMIVVTTPQVTALRDVHRFLEVLKLLSYDLDRVLLVVNNCYQQGEVKVKDLERALGHPIAQVIEYAPGPVTASLNRGVPLVQEYGDSLAARNIVSLARLLVERSARWEGEGVEGAPAQARKRSPKKRRLFFRRRPATADGMSL
jgi:pilus assembly protein CpaE